MRVIHGLIGIGCLSITLVSMESIAGTPSAAKTVPGYNLGTARVVSDTCTGTEPAGTQCRTLEVTCPNMPAIQVSLRITEPTAGTTSRGTLMFSSGGAGTAYYSSPELFKSLQDVGFRVVDRAWAGSWYQDSGGVRKGACRYATLATWVYKNLHSGPAFCGTGNSGGAAEVGHAMVTYGRGAIFDHVMPTGGPAVARLDYACLGQNNSEWSSLYDSIVTFGQSQGAWSSCVPDKTLNPNDGVCKAINANPTEQELLYDSVLAPDGVYSFPRTQTSFLEGTKDCQVSPVMGVLFHDTITSNKTLQFIANTPHAVSSTPEGRDALFAAFDQNCIARH